MLAEDLAIWLGEAGIRERLPLVFRSLTDGQRNPHRNSAQSRGDSSGLGAKRKRFCFESGEDRLR